MADYQSSLTGVQMDQALLDMAEHNSEAYAVGERNGIAVASDDVTYHNNARYYAQIASSQIVGDASSAVRWDTDQSEVLTDAQKAQARANIAAGGSNRNLLDNPWFTVNQRGASGTISSAGQFGADRWKKSGGSGSVIVGDGYFTPVGGGGYRQFNPWSKIISGRVYTVSAMTADGDVYSATGVLSSTTSGWQISSHLIPNSLWVGVQNNGGNLDILFTGQNGDIQVIAVKLELGSVSTLANDAPPDYNSELRKCRYYFRRISNPAGGAQWCLTGMNATATVAIFVLDNPMRSATKTISYSGALQVNGVSVTSVGSYTIGHDTTLSVVTGGGLTVYGGAGLIIGANGYLDISADL